jgi:hypothetical protein
MFPYRNEIQTQGTAYITASIIGLNVLAWIFIQGAGDILGVAWSVCNLGLIPGELTGRLPPGTQFSMGYDLVALPSQAAKCHTFSLRCFYIVRGRICSATCGSSGFSVRVCKIG